MAKLLIVSLVDPATHPGGAGTYTRGLITALRKGGSGHEITLIGPLHAPPGPWYRLRQTVSLAQSYISKLPAKVLFTRGHAFQVRIREISHSRHFDAALINGSDMLWAVDVLPSGMPTVLIAHNLEHQLLIQQLANYPFLSPVLIREIDKHRRYEIEGFRRVRGVIFLSSTDRVWGCAQIPELQTLHVPPLFMGPPCSRKRQREGPMKLGFLADFAWWPNRRNWIWLMEKILPHVCRPLIVQVYGRQSEQIPAGDRIVVHGLVQDLKMVWEQVDIMVCPVREGAGVSIKVAESLYNRVPVLATALAIRGLGCTAGAGLRILDSAKEWIEFLNSPEAELLAAQVPSDGLRRQFNPDSHMEKLDHFIKGICKNIHAGSGETW